MRYIADFHIHSKYSRACSKDLVPEKLHEWAQYKGIDVMGTGDFTHPLWFKELELKLEPVDSGLFQLRKKFHQTTYQNRRLARPVRFMLTAEISSIYSQDGQVRRIHTVLVAPTFEAVRKLNVELANIGNIKADGRPILGLSARDLAFLTLDIDKRFIVMPAHIWTPWFALFGSKSGFDSIEECFGDMAKHIFAVETGLSSDPEMNWRLSKLDAISLTSSSDAHSLPNLGREATVFDLPKLTYKEIYDALKKKQSKRLLGTIEFYPEEGKYHYDGHADHKVAMAPAETKKADFKCTVCKKPVTVGVMHRVDDLADRSVGFIPKDQPFSKHIVPLQEIIADALGVTKTTKKAQAEYWKMIHGLGNEFSILLDLDLKTIAEVALPKVVEGIKRVREGRIVIRPGYDGVYGVVKVFEDGERNSHSQTSLF